MTSRCVRELTRRPALTQEIREPPRPPAWGVPIPARALSTGRRQLDALLAKGAGASSDEDSPRDGAAGSANGAVSKSDPLIWRYGSGSNNEDSLRDGTAGSKAAANGALSDPILWASV